MLVKGLPPDALVRTPAADRTRDPWTGYHELIAQLIEVTSVGVAGRQLRKPITVTRPRRDGSVIEGEFGRAREVVTVNDGAGDNSYSRAISALQQSVPKRRQLALLQGGGEDSQ